MSCRFFGLLLMLLLAFCDAQADSVPLKRDGATYQIPVLINGKITLDFTLDTGAADVSIPPDVFDTLVRAGTVAQTDFVGTATYSLSDGSERQARRYRFRSVKVGNLELHNVLVSVGTKGSPLLLGQSFLQRLDSWSINNRQHLFIIDARPSADPSANSELTSGRTGPSWVYLGATHNGEYRVSIDTASIRIEGAIRRASERTDYASHSLNFGNDTQPFWVRRAERVLAFDCDHPGKYRQENVVVDFENGKKDSSAKIWHWELSDTDVEARFVCDWLPR